MTKIKSAMLAMALAMTAATAGAATLRIACGTAGLDQETCQAAAKHWAEKTGNEVELISMPNNSSEQLALYQQLLGSGSDKIDVMQIDGVWPGILANHLVDLKPYSKGQESQSFPSIVANNTVNGRLVAMPWFIDTGVLYYRKDLLDKYRAKVPATWDELDATARRIQASERAAGNEKLWGFVWQGRAYEGLTCDALEWIASHNGGTVVDDKGHVTIDNPGAIKGLDQAAKWVGTISPKAVLNYGEEESRGVFQAGNAVFMRNWPYALAIANRDGSPIKGKVGIAPLPKGGADGRQVASLGGWHLAVSRYSPNPKLAADLVMYMSSAEVQKIRAVQASFNPTIPALYHDKDVLQARPYMADLLQIFNSAVARPSMVTGAKYNQVSNQFWNAVHDVLAGSDTAASALARLAASLNRLAPGGNWR
ncbi:sugar ABC transporter substrate-binding protein [Burkholderia lata]|uniref:ABC transporter substrate-binding protein n=1 Tax=Burkholderia lata (strain ATCC 17760 / DSM 23089 / LMG 22485 / NCIMB 9086 / R18194 / 383) TaxID=482957 RepID=UPI001452DF51|nr:ABC transporter substrate-binding protein [Burkholderia lata]VWC20615.1 sugar ABC transporter substrate-binding protein [Burkholderia lata]